MFTFTSMRVAKETSDKRLVECLFGERHDVPALGWRQNRKANALLVEEGR